MNVMKKGHIKGIDRMVKLLKIVIICVLSFSMTGCSLYTNIYKDYADKFIDRSEKRHPFSWVGMQKDKMLVEFTEEQEKKILEAFNVVIPENEEEAYVYSFYFSKYEDYLNYILEIDGVKDYDAFFKANAGRVKENGLDGKSENELMKYYHPMTEYYISYLEVFYADPYAQTDEDKEMNDTLKSLYNEIKESKRVWESF